MPLNGKPRSWADIFIGNEVPDALFDRLLQNATSLRSGFFRQFSDARRDIDAECGYPSGLSVLPGLVGSEGYRDLFDRFSIANRVVSILPEECFQVTPTVYEDKSTDTETDFEDAVDQLGQSLRVGKSWFGGEQGSPIWSYFKRLDICSRIGHFGVLLLGVADGRNLDQPLDGVEEMTANVRSMPTREIPCKYICTNAAEYKTEFEKAGKSFDELRNQAVQHPSQLMGTEAQYTGVQLSPSRPLATKPSKSRKQLVYMRPFDESLVQIVQYEANAFHPRFGMPVMYRITLNDPREFHGGIGLSMTTMRVHWSRVIHVADNRLNSEIFGVPAIRPVLNNCLDLRKIYGADAEGYWQQAFGGISFETNPALGGDVEVDEVKFKGAIESYFNGLQRFLLLTGMQAKTLAPSVSDPTAHINSQLEAICIQIPCPKRVFMGSERGELASGQDDDKWLDVLRGRCNNHITSHIIVPTFDRLIACGVLPEPEEFFVGWPDFDSLNDTQRAAIGVQMMTSLSTYVQSGSEAVLPPKDFFTHVWHMEEEDAEAILDDAEKAHDSADTMTMPPQVEGRPAKAPPGTQDHAQAQQQAKQLQQAAQQPKGAPSAGAEQGAKPPKAGPV